VLNAESAEHSDGSVVHTNRDIEMVLSHRIAQEIARGLIELVSRDHREHVGCRYFWIRDSVSGDEITACDRIEVLDGQEFGGYAYVLLVGLNSLLNEARYLRLAAEPPELLPVLDAETHPKVREAAHDEQTSGL